MSDVLLLYPRRHMRLESSLSKAGFHVQIARNIEEAMIAIRRHQPDAVIISDDIVPPDSKQPHSRLRAELDAAIITLGGKDTCARAQAVEDGADLCLDDSVGDAELIARIRSLVRRYNSQS